ncbi:MAG TPA: hypothetical protein VJ914_26695 [Pseudonocardiaceae bacterium]|nr:hypothetical protein [Pseudonocardiaceae bacterium]
MPLRIELPGNWQAVGIEHDDGTDLAAFRHPEPGESFTPNLTLLTRTTPVDVAVRTLADRALGKAAREAASIAVFTEQDWGSGAETVVLRGFQLTNRSSSSENPMRLTRFQVHAGLPSRDGRRHDVATLVLSCLPAQRPLVEREFTEIVRSIALESQ